MPSWSFQLEGQVFDGVEIISMSHMDMKDKVLDPDPGSDVPSYASMFTGLNPSGSMVQHHIGEA